MWERKVLTSFVREGAERGRGSGEDRLQSWACFCRSRAVTCNGGDGGKADGWEATRGRGCRAKDAKGEGGKSRESERAHVG